MNQQEPLTLALPKGRLFDQVQEHFSQRGLDFSFEKRKLVAHDRDRRLKIMLVKNSDLPTYVHHGIAGLGICGDDVVYESGKPFLKLLPFSFGGTRICLAGRRDGPGTPPEGAPITVATKFTRFTRDYYHSRKTPVKIIKLNGSVELAPLLGLAPYIVDLVETGNTLRANSLEVLAPLKTIQVHLIANPAYYKLHYQQINRLIEDIREGQNPGESEGGEEHL